MATGFAIALLFNVDCGDQLYVMPPRTINWTGEFLQMTVSFDFVITRGVIAAFTVSVEEHPFASLPFNTIVN